MASTEEILAEAVRKYPIIYDKSRKSHKDKIAVGNAWKEIAEECEIESVERAKRLFENLKRRFAKRRRKVKGPSGTSTKSMAEAKERFRELSFLTWLEPFVTLRSTKSNCPSFKELTQSDDIDGLDDLSDEDSDKENVDISSEDGTKQTDKQDGDDDDDYDEADDDTNSALGKESYDISKTDSSGSRKKNNNEDLLFETPVEKKPTKQKKSASAKHKILSEVTRRPKWHQKTTIEDAQINFFKSAEKAMKSPESTSSLSTSTTAPSEKEEGENALFGRYIASEINQLPKQFQRVARHEINNVLYSVQNRAEQHQLNQGGYHFSPYQSVPSQESQYLMTQSSNQFSQEERQQPLSSFFHHPSQQLPPQHQNVQLTPQQNRSLQHTIHTLSRRSPQQHVMTFLPQQSPQENRPQQKQHSINPLAQLSPPRQQSEIYPQHHTTPGSANAAASNISMNNSSQCTQNFNPNFSEDIGSPEYTPPC